MVDQAEIHRKSLSDKVEDRIEAVNQLRNNFAILPDKEAAWRDLIRLTGDENREVRSGAADAFGAVFSAVPDKESAWHDLIRLTGVKDIFVPFWAADALGAAFSSVPDKESAWQDLIRLTGDENSSVRIGAAYALGVAFSAVPDKESAWQDLIRLTGDENVYVRFWVANALGSAFSSVPDKESAWQDLIRLTGDKDSLVREGAAKSLGVAFSDVPDKESAWQDLHHLTFDEDSLTRIWASNALGSAFSAVPYKESARQDLHRLTGDEESNVRVSANHSLGRASIFKATETKSEKEFRKELKNALQYFERSAAEAYSTFNPAKFCLPFYKSFFALTCKDEISEAEVERYLKEARDASEGSKRKDDLLEAVENLANALKEAQSLQEKSLHDLKRDLIVYSQYCNHFADLLDKNEVQAPKAVKLLRIGGKLVDKQIKGTVAEIQEIAKELCKMTVGTEVEPLGREVNQQAREISPEDYLRSDKSILRIAEILGDMCDLLPPKKREHACELVEEIQKCCNLEDRIIRLEAAINYIQPKIDIERYGKQFEYIKSEVKEIKSEVKDIKPELNEIIVIRINLYNAYYSIKISLSNNLHNFCI